MFFARSETYSSRSLFQLCRLQFLTQPEQPLPTACQLLQNRSSVVQRIKYLTTLTETKTLFPLVLQVDQVSNIRFCMEWQLTFARVPSIFRLLKSLAYQRHLSVWWHFILRPNLCNCCEFLHKIFNTDTENSQNNLRLNLRGWSLIRGAHLNLALAYKILPSFNKKKFWPKILKSKKVHLFSRLYENFHAFWLDTL